MAAQFATVELDNPLWQYALRIYSLPRAKPLFLRCQDEYELDVLLLISACWLSQQQRTWPCWDGVDDYRLWRQQVIRDIRAQRMALPKSHPHLAALLASELQTERYGMALIWAWLQTHTAVSEQPLNVLLDTLMAHDAEIDDQKKEALRPLFQSLSALAEQA